MLKYNHLNNYIWVSFFKYHNDQLVMFTRHIDRLECEQKLLILDLVCEINLF
jgi:hypothetical protein